MAAGIGLAPTRTAEQVMTLTIELLADQLHKAPADLRTELEGKGALLPVDSLDMFDILQEFRTRTGLTLPVKVLKRDTLRSVGAFTQFVLDEAN